MYVCVSSAYLFFVHWSVMINTILNNIKYITVSEYHYYLPAN